MSSKIILLFIIAASFLSNSQNKAQNISSSDIKIEIKNNDFENLSGSSLVLSWQFINSSTTNVDQSIKKSGSNSLLIIHNDWNKSEVISDPVELKIGHLYKLSAWIKTENAVTDPIDRYPTSVAASISMQSFPFTNHSQSVGATTEWTKIEVSFIATQKSDKIKLQFGNNGKAKGKVWFDNIEIYKVEDISEYIPAETVRWFNNGFRYDDQGWIFLHIEGAPYERGYQYGNLIAEELIEYINKIGIQQNKDIPSKGWDNLKFIADAMMLRKYETEYLTEMKGIADGVNNTGVKLFNRKLDLLDVVTLNSAIDIDYSKDAMGVTPNQLSGQSFLKSEDELNISNRLHKCSSFLANKSSTTDGRIVFGQIFMWGGYTGPHWNVICDVIPTEGNRLVYQTFPGGIHSGSDFYINSSGIMIGETTVGQTPFNVDGSPQSNRIRKAAQYANSIDDVVKILTTDNNGMYTNDWLIGDTKTDEIAVLLLGTKKHKLWRSGNNEFYGDTKDFYWCNNNNKDPEVRKEYITNPNNAPYDLIFAPWNRDVAFNEFYNEHKGNIDAIAGVNLWSSSPINRPHACDGKVTTSDMAENLVFLAHYGKVTLREMFVGENGRIPDLPGAFPRLSLGYSVISPIFITDKIKDQRNQKIVNINEKEYKINFDEVVDKYSFDERKLWMNTVYPASESENWFVSGSAAYWSMLKGIPKSKNEILKYFKDQFAELNARYLYTVNREGAISPINAKRIYTGFNNYQLPRIKGTYLLHQLRLLLGNDVFSELMLTVHEKFREKEMSTENFISAANKISGKDLTSFINQWLKRDDLPNPEIKSVIASSDGKHKLQLEIEQPNKPYNFLSAVEIKSDGEKIYKLLEITDSKQSFSFDVSGDNSGIEFNSLYDIPVKHNNYYTWSNIFDDWKTAKIVYGTKRQIEANHTLALRFSTALADRFTEDLIPIIKDSELGEDQLRNNDLIVMENIEDNSIMKLFCDQLKLKVGKNFFEWNDKTYGRSDEGLFLTLPNPYNNEKIIYLFITNSALELHQMTKVVNRMPQWAIFRWDKIIEQGYYNLNNQ